MVDFGASLPAVDTGYVLPSGYFMPIYIQHGGWTLMIEDAHHDCVRFVFYNTADRTTLGPTFARIIKRYLFTDATRQACCVMLLGALTPDWQYRKMAKVKRPKKQRVTPRGK